MIYLFMGVGLLVLLVAVGRRPSRLGTGARIARATAAVAVAAGAVALALRGGWPVSLALVAFSAWLGSPLATARSRAAVPPQEAMSVEQARSILGVGPDADGAEIEAAWRNLMRRAHPDQGGSSGLAAQVNAARARLVGKRS